MSPTKRIRLHITQEDIDNGVAGASQSCPIALSLHRRGYTLLGVGTRELFRRTDEFGGYEEFALPTAASNFIYEFDLGDAKFLKPTYIYVDVPA